MQDVNTEIQKLINKKEAASLHVKTMGEFVVKRDQVTIPSKDWGRDKTIQLFQFLVTARQRRGLHKEQIIDRLWEDADQKGGDRDFKVALHGINKVLEPDRKSRTDYKYITRQGVTYQLNLEEIWIDVEGLERFISLGNDSLHQNKELAIKAYKEALSLHEGVYLPNRLYEDWSSEERERLQVLILGAYTSLAELLTEMNPMESVRLTQKALSIDSVWEDAYRIQMAAYFAKGNRPAAIKCYKKCVDVLEEELGLEPLPETKRLLEKIRMT